MSTEKVLLGAGCFWGVEHILKKIEGVVSTEVGYAGGSLKDPDYPQVSSGTTGHAEVVQVEYDPAIISFEKVLDLFFRLHDPTTLNRQHNDIGTQYRSVIFYYTDQQEKIAKQVIKSINASGIFKDPVVTQLLIAPPFYPAEAYHQDYLDKNPSGYMCHILKK